MIIDKEDKEDKEDKRKCYVNPKVFREQLALYYDSDKMTNELASNICKIAEGLSYNYRFIRYTPSWKEEMIGDAKVKMYIALEKKLFRLESLFSPFAYFNQIAWNAFTNRIKREKKQHDGLEEYKQMMYEGLMGESSGDGHIYVKPCSEYDENDCGYED
jgi:hypothetical protein